NGYVPVGSVLQRRLRRRHYPRKCRRHDVGGGSAPQTSRCDGAPDLARRQPVAIEELKPMSHKVAVFVGSLRDESINRKLAEAFIRLAPDTLEFEYVPIDEVPHYDQDLETDPPESVVRLKERIEAADALLFVTPEYNRSVPGVLKNAID